MTYTAAYDNNNPAPNLCRPSSVIITIFIFFLYYFKHPVPGVIRFTICIDHYYIHSLSVLLQEPWPGGHKIYNFVDLLLVIMTMYLVCLIYA